MLRCVSYEQGDGRIALKIDTVTYGWRITGRCMLAVLTATAVAGTGCASRSSVAGKWEGLLNVGVMVGARPTAQDTTFHVALNIRRENDHLKASYESLEDRSGPVPVDVVEFKNGSLFVKFRKQGGTYEGKLNPASTEFHGAFKQGGYDIPLVLKRAAGS
jgi:hypothetical protein